MEREKLCFQSIPSYSTELNGIEILWHHIKHVWLKIEDFQSYETSKKAIKSMLSKIGGMYSINFN